MKKKMLAVLLGATMIASLLAGCGSNANTDTSESNTKTPEETAAEEETTDVQEELADADDDAQYTIGITQFAQHGSLENCKEGFLLGLKEEGIEEGKNLTISFQNAEADTGIATQIAQSFVSDKVDLICAIATPSAQTCYNTAMDTDIPVVYTAVTDPVAALLANEDMSAAGNTTGTSDKLPVEAQLKMIREVLPDAETIGILYTTSEVNSESAIAEYEALVGDYGFELEVSGVSSTADIALATDALLEKVDCITNLTDNTVVSALPSILDKANEKNIPVFGSEIEQVKIGCLAAEGLDYIQLGIQTGKMAAKILKGEASASEMNYEIIAESSLYINEEAAAALDITFSDETKGRAVEIFDSIEAAQ